VVRDGVIRLRKRKRKRSNVDNTQNIISFCTGYGGLELGIRRAGVDVRVVCNVEIEAFVQANLVAKTEEGRMDNAPIYSDLKTFPAREFRGKVHGLIGGYPCQPFSSAGKRQGEKDPRHLWPYILKHVRAIRPVWCFWENVAGHTTMGLWRVLSDLEEEGYRTTFGIFSAEEVGAPHQRKRVFILACLPNTQIEGARTAKESNQKCLGRDLNQMNWATPNTMDHLPPKTGEALARNKKKGGCKNLREDVNNPKMNWPTPRAGNPGSRKPGTGGKILAEEAKKNWATPQGRDHLSAESKEKWEARAKLQAEKGVNLHLPLNTQCQHIMEEQHNGLQDQEKSSTSGKNHGSWPTARSSDAEGGRIKTEKTEKGFRSKREKSDQYFGAKLRDAAEMEKPPSMKLNPNWVEQLMGLSTGWTDLGSWGMELSHKQQN